MSPQGFKPNLAATLTKPELIKFPVWASPKIDGIRCVVCDGVAYSRSLKPIPNEFVQSWVRSMEGVLQGLDGELVVGSPTDPNCMQNSMAVMRKAGEPDFTFFVFDLVLLNGTTYDKRQDHLQFSYMQCPEFLGSRAKLLPQYSVSDHADLATLEAQWLADGYEGMMVRRGDAEYKCGRSTEREGGLVKVKRFVDAEATVIGYEEEMHNANERKTNALGNAERSSVSSGLVGKDTLGALRCRSSEGYEFNIGTGFTASQRRDLWGVRESLTGRLVTYKYFAHGIKEAPRHPVFKSFRHIEDT